MPMLALRRARRLWPRLEVVALCLCLYAATVTADTWRDYAVRDRAGRIVGRGIEVTGQMTDGYRVRLGQLNADCAGGRTVIRLEVRNFDFGTAPVRVRWTVPNNKEGSTIWDVCDDGSCIGRWDGEAFAFLQKIVEASELQVSIEVPHARPVNATFKLEGTDAAMRSLSRNCQSMR